MSIKGCNRAEPYSDDFSELICPPAKDYYHTLMFEGMRDVEAKTRVMMMNMRVNTVGAEVGASLLRSADLTDIEGLFSGPLDRETKETLACMVKAARIAQELMEAERGMDVCKWAG